MQISIEKLRRWLLFGAAGVVLVIAGYLVLARIERWRSPGEHVVPLPKGIHQQTNGFTYSKSNQGRTLFTIHAARAVQLQQSGQAELYDVSITMYSRVDNREDRISGSEFHYDQSTGVATAKGEVLLDLQVPSGQSVGHDRLTGVGADRGTIHVKTQGLVFVQNLGVAATNQPLEFAFDGITGHATGAEYDSDSAILTLQSAVDATMLVHGSPLQLTAAHAVLDHAAGESRLTSVNIHTATESAHADTVVVHLRKDGSVDSMDASGGVTATGADYGTLTAPEVQMWIDTANQPLRAVATGGVRYVDRQPLLQREASAADAEVIFGAKSSLRLVHLNGNVAMYDHIESVAAGSRAAVREIERNLAAAHITLGFSPQPAVGRSKRAQLQTVHAEGGARFTTQQPSANTRHAGGIEFREMDADAMDGVLAQSSGRTYFSSVDGSGHTRLVQKSPDGTVDTSSGDTLRVVMRPQLQPQTQRQAQAQVRAAQPRAPQHGSRSGQPGSPVPVEIATAVQTGNVMLAESKPATAAAKASATTGRAARAEFNGATHQLVLTGSPQVSDAGTTLWADTITLDQATGNLLAETDVKANYAQTENAEPIHIIAGRAELLHATQRAIFYGSPGADARLWQQSSQVSAPELQIDRTSQTLTAHGAPAAAQPVHAVFPAQSMPSPSTKPSTSKETAAHAAAGGVIRVASREMVYSDATHKAVFSGGVDVLSADSHTRARQATVWLKNTPATQNTSAAKNAPPLPALGGSVERILAEGAVTVEQPDRHAQGEALNYTAADGHYLLTGTPAQPPKLVDDIKGTVTGASLLFESNNDTVIVSGANGYNRPRVDTHAK